MSLTHQQLQKLILKTLEDSKAKDIINMDVRELTSVTDNLIICSGTSNRHLQSVADHVVEAVKREGVEPIGVEGKQPAEWVLVDLGDIVVHVMLPRAREFYSLEKLWSATESNRKAAGQDAD